MPIIIVAYEGLHTQISYFRVIIALYVKMKSARFFTIFIYRRPYYQGIVLLALSFILFRPFIDMRYDVVYAIISFRRHFACATTATPVISYCHQTARPHFLARAERISAQAGPYAEDVDRPAFIGVRIDTSRYCFTTRAPPTKKGRERRQTTAHFSVASQYFCDSERLPDIAFLCAGYGSTRLGTWPSRAISRALLESLHRVALAGGICHSLPS